MVEVKKENIEEGVGREETIERLGYIATRGYYQMQEARKALNSMVRDLIYRKNEGIGLHETLDEGEGTDDDDAGYTDEEIDKILDDWLSKGLLSDEEQEYINKLRDTIQKSEKYEDMYEDLMAKTVMEDPVWYNWLEDVTGIGPVLAANLLRFYGHCETYDTVSKMWKHSGMHPAGAQNKTKGEKIDYDPQRKTLAWKISDSFIKCASEKYKPIYDNEKKRQMRKKELKEEGREDEYKGSAPESQGHASNRARRKTSKIFLQHYWVISRQLKGMSTEPPYVHDKLKHDNYIEPSHVPDILKPFDTIREAHWICQKYDECKHPDPDEDCKA